MAENTKIEWCDHTFNPWIGCAKVSAGCANCYAEREDGRRHWTPEGFGKGKPRKRTSAANWRLPLKWDKAAGLSPEHVFDGVPQRRPRVFCGSLCDWLDDEVDIKWFADLLALISWTPNLDWLLLSKRPGNFWGRMTEARGGEFSLVIDSFIDEWMSGDSPKNVLIGATVENQEMAGKRIPELLKIPARARFLSCEPLLGAVDLEVPTCGECGSQNTESCISHIDKVCKDCGGIATATSFMEGIDWVICGGESGPRARPMHPGWARSLRYQCKNAGVPFFFKQWGEWLPLIQALSLEESLVPRSIPRQNDSWLGGGERAFRIGKRAAGRLLDGVEHSEFPNIQTAKPM
jgi:protein gp37